MLTRLGKKGCMKHRQEGLRYIYSATVSPAAAKRTALQQLQTCWELSLPASTMPPYQSTHTIAMQRADDCHGTRL
jgi:predicted transcriptional regulator